MKRTLLLAFVLLCLAQGAAAERAAYFVTNTDFPDQNIKGSLEQAGHSVHVIDNEDVLTVDWNDYDFMVISDQVYQNEMDFPVNRFPAIILNTNYMDEWHWSSRTSQKTSSVPIKAFNNDQESIITQGLPAEIPLFTSSKASVNYLHRYYRAATLKPVVSTSNASVWDTLNAIIATAEPGTRLRDTVVSETKSVFFGITASQYWTPESKKLLQQSAAWLTTDFYPPVFSDIQVTGVANSSATISWKTDKPSISGLMIDGKVYTSHAFGTSHQFSVTGLSEDTLYGFTLSGCNTNGYCGESSAQELKTADFTPPQVTGSQVKDITNQSATVEASISETGYFSIVFGESPTTLDSETEATPTGTGGSITIEGLKERMEYHFVIRACDDSGTCADRAASSFLTLDFTAPEAPANLVLSVGNDGKTVTASWDPPSDDATAWSVYIGDTPETIDFYDPYAITTTTTYSDSSAPGERYYAVRAQDDATNMGPASRVAGKYNVKLEEGYNLVSLPLIPFDSDIGAVMHQGAVYHPVIEIIRWDAENQSFEKTTFSNIQWHPLGFQVLEYGRGYFFGADIRTDFIFVGLPPQPVQRRMLPGMNLIGATDRVGQDITGLVSQDSSSVKATLVAKRGIDGEYAIMSYDGEWRDEFEIVPGRGYWLKAEQEFMI